MNTETKFEGKNRCPDCGLFFMSQSQVDRHIAKRHGPIVLREHIKRTSDGCDDLSTGMEAKGSYLLSRDGRTAYKISL